MWAYRRPRPGSRVGITCSRAGRPTDAAKRLVLRRYALIPGWLPAGLLGGAASRPAGGWPAERPRRPVSDICDDRIAAFSSRSTLPAGRSTVERPRTACLEPSAVVPPAQRDVGTGNARTGVLVDRVSPWPVGRHWVGKRAPSGRSACGSAPRFRARVPDLTLGVPPVLSDKGRGPAPCGGSTHELGGRGGELVGAGGRGTAHRSARA
jgi:hypothetical protein